MEHYDVIVIGGGAAGFFAALQVCEENSLSNVLILERSTKILTKVKVSGGGRCNVTHSCFDASQLAGHYPRGAKWLRPLFRHYGVKEVVDWFGRKDVQMKTEDDGRMFPVSNSSLTIVDCFLQSARQYGIALETGAKVVEIRKQSQTWAVVLQGGRSLSAPSVLVASGGSSDPSAYRWIEELGHSIRKPIPSLFTFNHPAKTFRDLMGLSVPNAEVAIAGSKFKFSGPVLITHWGLSGPAVIRLSAWAAEYLHQQNYEFTALVNWTGGLREHEIRQYLLEFKSSNGRKGVINNALFSLPIRLWQRVCELAGVAPDKIWAELPQKTMNRLMEFLIRCPFEIKGKTTFKEEFVTCGGVSLEEVNEDTMESKICRGIFFAGEVLNIDGETGGFNFQAAWTTAHIAAKAIAKKQSDRSTA